MNHRLIEQGRCSGSDNHNLFFSDRHEDLVSAQAMCGGCEVRGPCLELAVELSVEWGVWGGVIFWDGQPMLRKRGRGRPRKDDRDPFEIDRSALESLVRSA